MGRMDEIFSFHISSLFLPHFLILFPTPSSYPPPFPSCSSSFPFSTLLISVQPFLLYHLIFLPTSLPLEERRPFLVAHTVPCDSNWPTCGAMLRSLEERDSETFVISTSWILDVFVFVFVCWYRSTHTHRGGGGALNCDWQRGLSTAGLLQACVIM